jgi:hypothetical protein
MSILLLAWVCFAAGWIAGAWWAGGRADRKAQTRAADRYDAW